MKTKDRKAARAKAKLPWRRQGPDHDAPEVLDWFEKWTMTHSPGQQQEEMNNNQGSQHE